jgi:hypothetical protein
MKAQYTIQIEIDIIPSSKYEDLTLIELDSIKSNLGNSLFDAIKSLAFKDIIKSNINSNYDTSSISINSVEKPSLII